MDELGGCVEGGWGEDWGETVGFRCWGPGGKRRGGGDFVDVFCGWGFGGRELGYCGGG